MRGSFMNEFVRKGNCTKDEYNIENEIKLTSGVDQIE